MKRVLTKTTYLEMFAPPAANLPPLPGTRIERLHAPTAEGYRSLYNGVGRAFHWTDRNRMADDELLRIIQSDSVEIYVLYVDGEPAGYVELDRRIAGEVQIAYFGLFPAFIGKGLGKYFLAWRSIGHGRSGRGACGSIPAIWTMWRPFRTTCVRAFQSMMKSSWSRSFPMRSAGCPPLYKDC